MHTEKTQIPCTPRIRDWKEIRTAYLEEAERPTYEELATRFSIPLGSLCRAAADEGWAVLRAKRLELAMQQSDVVGALVAAAKGERIITDKFREFAVVMLSALIVECSQLPAKQAAKVKVLTAISFAAKNTADAIKAVGLTGLPKRVQDSLEGLGSGTEEGFRGAMAAINLTLNVNGQKGEAAIETRPPSQVASS